MGSRIIIKGTIAILVQRTTVARRLQGLFRENGMNPTIVSENHEKLAEFLRRGQGLLITDTVLGFRPIRALKDAENLQIAVVFLRRPNDAFSDETLLGFGPFVVGVFEEELDEEQLDRLIRLAVQYESDIDPAITIDDEES